MTKQEQIDEIEYIICESFYTKSAAQNLYNAGYRKVLLDTEDGEMVDCVQYAPWELIKGYTEKEVNKASRETAEKILQPLYDACKEDTYGQVVVDFAILENLAKQFDVEIKE